MDARRRPSPPIRASRPWQARRLVPGSVSLRPDRSMLRRAEQDSGIAEVAPDRGAAGCQLEAIPGCCRFEREDRTAWGCQCPWPMLRVPHARFV